MQWMMMIDIMQKSGIMHPFQIPTSHYATVQQQKTTTSDQIVNIIGER